MQKTNAMLLKYVGLSKSAVPVPFRPAVDAAADAIEMKYPKAETAKIQGSQPHVSSKDPKDPKKVITISYHTAQGTRIASVHVHDDETFKEFPSRNANKGK